MGGGLLLFNDFAPNNLGEMWMWLKIPRPCCFYKIEKEKEKEKNRIGAVMSLKSKDVLTPEHMRLLIFFLSNVS